MLDDCIYSSKRIRRIEPPEFRAYYAWMLPLVMANGVFLADPDEIWSKAFAITHPHVTPEIVGEILKAFEKADLIFRWKTRDGKWWGYYKYIDKPGRLPPRSRREHYKLGPEPPMSLIYPDGPPNYARVGFGGRFLTLDSPRYLGSGNSSTIGNPEALAGEGLETEGKDGLDTPQNAPGASNREVSDEKMAQIRVNALIAQGDTSSLPGVEEEALPKRTRRRPRDMPLIVPPEEEEVFTEMTERGMPYKEANTQAGYFIDHFKARGWKLKGGAPMEDWRSSVGEWTHHFMGHYGGGGNGSGKTGSPAQERARRTNEAAKRILGRSHEVDDLVEPRLGPGTDGDENRRLRADVEPPLPK